MKARLNIPALVVLALPVIPIFMFVIPPLLNAHSTYKNLGGLALVGLIVLWLAGLAVKVIKRIFTRLAVNRLLK